MVSVSKTLLILATILLPFDFLKLIYNFSFIDLLYLLSFFGIIIYQIRNLVTINKLFNDNIFLIPIIIYSIGFFISFNNSFDPIDSIFSYFQICFIFIIIYYSFSLHYFSKELLIRVLYIFAILSALVTLSIFVYFITGKDYSYGLLLVERGWGMIRFSYGDMEPNVTARIIIQSIPIFLLITYRNKNLIIRIFNILLIMLLVSVLILTASRSGFLIFLVGIASYFIFYVRYKTQYNILYSIT